MKNTILISSFFLLATSADAQNGWYDTHAGSLVGIGIEAGANAMNMTTNFQSVELTAKKQYTTRLGIKAGIPVNIDIKQRLDIRTGLYFSQKGLRKMFIDEGDEGSETVDMRINYLELPVNLLIRVGHKRNLYFGPGAYVARAINGQATINDGVSRKLMFNPETLHHNYYPDAVPYTFKPWDAGLTATLGYRLPKHFFIQAQYEHGLTDIGRYTTAFNKATYTNWGFSVTAGWLIRERN